MDFVGDPDGGWRHMRGWCPLRSALRMHSFLAARVEQREYMRTARSPSESVESPASIKGTLESPCGPRYGRPSDRFGPPTALFSRALALLKKDLDHLDAFMPTPLFAKSAFSFISHAAGLYIDEARRQEFLRESLNDLLQGKGRWQTQLAGGSAKPDGVWMEGLFAYLIIEMKNEPGLGGDPLLRGLVVYSKIVGHEEVLPFPPVLFTPLRCPKQYAQFLGQSNLPVVLLAIAGNRLVISTAIYTDSIYADEVLSVKLYLGPHASDNVLRVARIFMAINKCTERLRRLYVNLKPDTHSMQPAKVLWPNPTLDSPSPEIPGLEFFSKVDRSLGTPIKQTDINEENKRHAIYLARMRVKGSTLTTDVLVKFAVKYNMVAHRLLAEHEPPLAPVLHSCAPVIGDMYMVVMQYIPDASLLNASLPLPAPNLEAVRRDIKQALDLLHAQDLVFGDLREANVLYLPEGGGRALLVDFDGVGRHGKDRYSACLNPDVGLGVDGFQVMKKSHDIQNFEKLMERLSGEF